MPTVTCPNDQCGKSYQVGDASLGGRARCKSCGSVFELAWVGDQANAANGSADGASSNSTGSTHSEAAQLHETEPDGFKASGQSEIPETLGRFKIKSVLGSGTFGTVYHGYDPQLDREVALKVPNVGVLRTEEEAERFLREARAAASLRHPNICPVFEANEQDGRYCIVMAFISGKTLSSLITPDKPASERQVVSLVQKLAQALDLAHQKGVIHRDLKPGNILFDQESHEPVIMDFGLARRSSDSQITQDGQILGTPAYMSPEQAMGQTKAIGPASDVYSLGVIFYELLCCTRPFPGSAEQVRAAHYLKSEAEPPSTHRAGISATLEAICLKAMSHKIEDRSSMAELAVALSHYVPGTQPKQVKARLHRSSCNSFWQSLPHGGKSVAGGSLAGALLLVLLWGVLVVIRDRGGNEVARGNVPEGGSVTVVTAPSVSVPAVAPVAPAPPSVSSSTVVYLDDLQEASWSGAALGKHGMEDGARPMVWLGQKPEHGLFMHPHSNSSAEITYSLDGKYDEFYATIGVLNKPITRLTFRVYGDDKLLWESAPQSVAQSSTDVNVSVGNVGVLKLEVHCPGSFAYAHAVWVHPCLTPIDNGAPAIPNLGEMQNKIFPSLVRVKVAGDNRIPIGVVTESGVCTIMPGSFTSVELESLDGASTFAGTVTSRSPFPFCWIESTDLHLRSVASAKTGTVNQPQDAFVALHLDGATKLYTGKIEASGAFSTTVEVVPQQRGVVGIGPIFAADGTCLGLSLRSDRDKPIVIYPLKKE